MTKYSFRDQPYKQKHNQWTVYAQKTVPESVHHLTPPDIYSHPSGYTKPHVRFRRIILNRDFRSLPVATSTFTLHLMGVILGAPFPRAQSRLQIIQFGSVEMHRKKRSRKRSDRISPQKGNRHVIFANKANESKWEYHTTTGSKKGVS